MQISNNLLIWIGGPDIEGTILHPYHDQKGLLTIGIGHLITPTEKMNGFISVINDQGFKSHITIGPISDNQAQMLLRADMHIAETCVNKLVKVQLPQNKFDALCSLTFNIGTGGFSTSTVLKLVNSGDWDKVPDAFRMWKNITVDGMHKVSDGLVKRREAEIKIWLKGYN